MNEPACRAYRAAQYLPSYTAAATLNSTLRLSRFGTSSPTNPIAADATFTELQASSASPKLPALAILYKN